MKPSFLPTARPALVTLLLASALGTACEPNNDVPPGAPVLTELTLVTPGPAATTITATTPDCPSGIVGGEACNPMMDGLCRQSMTSWCSSCVPDQADMTGMVGTWDCTPFGVLAVVGVFDRLLDTVPFDAGYPKGIENAITGSASATAPTFKVITDYASTGTPMGITPLFAFFFSGNFRDHGPSVFGMPAPGFPSAAEVTVTLDPAQLRAKDGTPFTAEGLLQSGVVGFTMPAFSASVAPPDDNNANPRVIFNNNVTDEVIPDLLTGRPGHITVTANGADITTQVAMGLNAAVVTIQPASGAWPAGAVIVITVDAATQNTVGQAIDGAHTGMFTAP